MTFVSPFLTLVLALSSVHSAAQTVAPAAPATNAAPTVLPGGGQTAGYVPPPLRPSATPFVPGVNGGVPQINHAQLPIDTVTPVPVDEDAQAAKDEKAQQLMKSLGQMMGGGGGGGGGGAVISPSGRSESAGSGGSDYVPTSSSGVTNALQYTGDTTTRGGREYKNINGCSKESGKFSFIYGTAGSSCSTTKDGKLKMSSELADFMDKNLNRCAAKAAGANQVGEGIIYHAGTIGDLRHQKTGSLHNLGLAIDVKAMKVNGRTYVFEKPGDKDFFNAFRACWSEAANKERSNCLKPLRSGKPPGTIGEENSAHHHHLHLSLPLCPDEARRQGVNIALLRVLSFFAVASAHAANAADDGVTMTRKMLTLPKGKAELVITDQNGEPVDADQRFRINVRCANETKARVLVDDLGGCEFATFEYLAPQNALELRYRISVPRDGELFCGTMQTKVFPTGCPR